MLLPVGAALRVLLLADVSGEAVFAVLGMERKLSSCRRQWRDRLRRTGDGKESKFMPTSVARPSSSYWGEKEIIDTT